MTGWQTFLLVGGTGLELIGIGLAVLDSLDVRRAFRQRSVVALAGTARGRATGHDATVIVSDEPTLEERVQRLEGEAQRLRDDIMRRDTELREEWRGEIASESERVQRHMDHEVGDVRRLLGVSAQPNRRRAIGYGLFAIGLIFQTASQFRW